MYILEAIFYFVILFHASSGVPAYGSNTSGTCSDDQLRLCADNAEPVLRGSAVPDSPGAVNQVCGVWMELTSCIANYTKRCLKPSKRVEFEQATNDPIMAMTKFCRSPDQQIDYLTHAPCLKKISTEERYCGKQYVFLIDLVAEGNMKQVCCARAKFMNCLMAKTPTGCESRRADSGKNSTKLAVAILDSSLAFMSQRCEASRFKESDCPGMDVPRENSKGPLNNQQFPVSSGTGFGSQFQLDQGQQQQGGWIKGSGSGIPVGVRPTTTTKEIKERPVADQFASTANKEQRPQTRPGESGASSLLHDHFLFASVSLLGFSRHTYYY